MRRVAVLALITACGFHPGALQPDAMVDAVPDAPPDAALPQVLRVEAWIDGRSQLVITGHSAHWHHYQYAAPGRELHVMKPTLFDGVAWQPVWPDVPDDENRDCDCNSSSYDALPITVPMAPAMATVTTIQARKDSSVIQQAASDNGWTLVVELTDIGFGGSSTNIVDITIAPP